MSCIGCENYAKRITNIYRDEDLRLKYAELTGCKIQNDCFICDECNEKLEDFYSFKHQCIEIHRKLNPDFQIESVESVEEVNIYDDTKPSITREIFVLSEGNEAMLTEEDVEEEFLLSSVVEDCKHEESEQQYEDIYFAFEEEEKCVEAESEQQKRNVVVRKSYTVEEKLKIVAYAEEKNNRQAARFFKMNESSVRCFRRQKEMLEQMNPKKKTNRKAFPHWPLLETELKEFVMRHPIEHGTKPKLKEIRAEAIAIAAKHGIENFNGSSSYIFKFMQRHQLPSASPRPRKHPHTVKNESK